MCPTVHAYLAIAAASRRCLLQTQRWQHPIAAVHHGPPLRSAEASQPCDQPADQTSEQSVAHVATAVSRKLQLVPLPLAAWRALALQLWGVTAQQRSVRHTLRPIDYVPAVMGALHLALRHLNLPPDPCLDCSLAARLRELKHCGVAVSYQAAVHLAHVPHALHSLWQQAHSTAEAAPPAPQAPVAQPLSALRVLRSDWQAHLAVVQMAASGLVCYCCRQREDRLSAVVAQVLRQLQLHPLCRAPPSAQAHCCNRSCSHRLGMQACSRCCLVALHNKLTVVRVPAQVCMKTALLCLWRVHTHVLNTVQTHSQASEASTWGKWNKTCPASSFATSQACSLYVLRILPREHATVCSATLCDVRPVKHTYDGLDFASQI